MAKINLNTIKSYFLTGLKPTQAQFWNVWDSFRHKDDAVTVAEVTGLQDLLDAKVDNASSGLFRIGTYMVDRKGGTNVTIKAGNIIYGTGAFFGGQYIIAEALIDDPEDDAGFKDPYYQGL